MPAGTSLLAAWMQVRLTNCTMPPTPHIHYRPPTHVSSVLQDESGGSCFFPEPFCCGAVLEWCMVLSSVQPLYYSGCWLASAGVRSRPPPHLRPHRNLCCLLSFCFTQPPPLLYCPTLVVCSGSSSGEPSALPCFLSCRILRWSCWWCCPAYRWAERAEVGCYFLSVLCKLPHCLHTGAAGGAALPTYRWAEVGGG